MDLAHYFIAIDDVDPQVLIQDWRWLVGDETYSLVHATAMGSLLLRDERGGIRFLDTTDATFDLVAQHIEELDGLLEDRHQRRTLLWTFLVRELRDNGITLQPGQCYSWRVPLALGGQGVPANIEPTDLLVHLSVMGQLHHQIRNLPPGTRIDEIVTGGTNADDPTR